MYLRSVVQTEGQGFRLGDDAPHSLLHLWALAVEQEAIHQAASRLRGWLRPGGEDYGSAGLCASQRIGLRLQPHVGTLKQKSTWQCKGW